MPNNPVQATTTSAPGYWDCDCGRECRTPQDTPGCRAAWVETPDAPPWTQVDLLGLRSAALLADLRNAERLLTEHGYTVTPPTPDASA